MILIDGSLGEGGGQVLRSAISLSAITRQPIRISSIRAKRSKPGLQAQHLTAVKAAAKITHGSLEGACPGATELEFFPGEIEGGHYRFGIPTAGAASLVLQTIFLPLSLAQSASSVTISGGTHVPWSPCYHYLEEQWLPYLERIGCDADLGLELAGFYPRGAGRMHTRIRPAGELAPLQLTRRGELLSISGISAVANLEREIAARQRRRALERLGIRVPVTIRLVELPSKVQGTFLLLTAEFELVRYCTFALGKKGLPAEQVADMAIDELDGFLKTEAALDRYLADQLLLPLALASGTSTFSTERVTPHLTTNAAILQEFLPGRIKIEGEVGQPGRVTIEGAMERVA
jgi:RNA 3'-terminal phosphate cyclase (ATP)